MSDNQLTAYCVKCRTTRPLQDAQAVYMANGRPGTRGVCAECGTGLFKIGETEAHAGLPKPDAPATKKVDRGMEKQGNKGTTRQGDKTDASEFPSVPLTAEVQAYCVKCKAMRPMKDGRAIFMANSRPAAEGVCAECGTKLFKIGATADHAGLMKPVLGAGERGSKGDKVTRRQGDKVGVSASKHSSDAAPRTAGRNPQSPIPNTRSPSGKLVIVESPAKARTVGRFLGRGYDVRASVGHVRDLLKSRLSVDLEHDFAPTYRVPNEKKDVVKALKEAAAGAKEIYLATDPDREGEAIAWHLLEAAEIPPARTRRVVFHEITKGAIAEAFAHSRDIDMQLVDAQQARRILDRLVGYQISPLLWERVRSGLSAGRVQSVALRLIVEREREILAFVPVEYWSIDAELAQQTTRGQKPRPSFLARLIRIQGQEADLKNRADTQAIVADLQGAAYTVASVKRGERKRRPNPPFTTSTMQQDASQRLGMTAARAMRVAQDLYEGIDIGEGGGPVGLITYMRTDSVNVAQEAQAEARALITDLYGPEYLPAEPNVYRARAKNAQEAHEAIRPTSCRRAPAALRDKLNRDQLRLYELIWQRFVASQMAAAVYDTLTVDVEAGQPGAAERPYLLRASGSKIRFPGFLVVYSGGASGPAEDRPATEDGRRTTNNGSLAAKNGNGAQTHDGTSSEVAESEILPDLTRGELLDLLRLLPEQHFTQPPPRYTEASLVKTLEENGIGRPSTYAAIIATLLEREYVARQEKKLAPTDLGFTVNDLLVKHFDRIFEVGFTASMEEHLDSISRGEEEMVPVLRNFYDFFAPQLKSAEEGMEKVALAPEKTGEACPDCGGDLLIKNGRFGKFVGCANYPTCKYTKPLLLKIGVACPKDGGDLAERRTRKGRTFFGCANYPACDFTSWKRPLPQKCPKCSGMLVIANKQWAECTVCHERVKIELR
ncbi:MAG: type I DNA topoisomerase [Chloroflexi bacterium]|nr:type I DNA topoisomerase [Chloroflexota bacterium]